MKNIPGQKRICIYPKDIVLITGKSERYGRKLIEKIKKENSKKSYQVLTVEEFCSYMGLDAKQVHELITA
jgi:hypothetical protein